MTSVDHHSDVTQAAKGYNLIADGGQNPRELIEQYELGERDPGTYFDTMEEEYDTGFVEAFLLLNAEASPETLAREIDSISEEKQENAVEIARMYSEVKDELDETTDALLELKEENEDLVQQTAEKTQYDPDTIQGALEGLIGYHQEAENQVDRYDSEVEEEIDDISEVVDHALSVREKNDELRKDLRETKHELAHRDRDGKTLRKAVKEHLGTVSEARRRAIEAADVDVTKVDEDSHRESLERARRARGENSE